MPIVLKEPLEDGDQVVMVTVFAVADQYHTFAYGRPLHVEHGLMHNCACVHIARYLLMDTPLPNMYWPDGKGGNAWDRVDKPDQV